MAKFIYVKSDKYKNDLKNYEGILATNNNGIINRVKKTN